MTLHERTGADSAVQHDGVRRAGPPQRRVGGSHVPTPITNAMRTPSAVVYRIGGREYPMRTVSQCKVCQSHYRVEIERALIKSYSFATIHRSLPEQGQAELTVRNIAEHVHRQHLPVDESVRRAMVESRAQEVGASIEDSIAPLADHITFARVGLQKVYEGMAEGSLQPDVKDGIAFAQMLMKVESAAGEGVDNEAVFRAFMSYMSALRQVCSPDQVRQMGEIIGQDPVMASLLNRSASIVDGAVVP